MDHAPTEEEKTAVYRYCTTSRDLMLNKKRFSDKKKPLNTKMKEVRSTLLQSMEEKGHLCYKVGDQYMRVTECTSKKSLTIEMVLEALHTFTIDELSIEDAIDGLTDKMEHVRSTTKKYVKMMKQPPKIKTQIVDLNEADTSIIEEYKNTENMLNTVRNEEKESSKMLQEQVKSLIAPVEGYMKRVDLSTQRIQLGDKEVKGLAHTFYLRRREKTTSKKLSKKMIKQILTDILPQYFSDYASNIDFIARDMIQKIEELKETSHVLSFGKGNLELKR